MVYQLTSTIDTRRRRRYIPRSVIRGLGSATWERSRRCLSLSLSLAGPEEIFTGAAAMVALARHDGCERRGRRAYVIADRNRRRMVTPLRDMIIGRPE